MDDLLHFAERAQHNRERNVKFIFLLDGSFYSKKTKTHSRYYGETKSFKATPFQLPTFTFGGSLYYVSPDQGEATWNDAKSICSNLVYADYADWYLPDEGELNVMYEQKSSIGGFSNVAYWSSREYSSDRAGYQHFSDGYQSYSYKSNTKRVRCVRKEN